MNVQEESILSVYAHLGGEGEVVYTQKGDEIITCGDDSMIKIWKLENHDISSDNVTDLYTNESVTGLLTFKKSILSFSKDLLIPEYSKTNDEWKYSKTFTQTALPYTAKLFHSSADKEYIFIALEDGQLLKYSFDDPAHPVKFNPPQKSPVIALAHHSSAPKLASITKDGTVKIWDTTTMKVCETFPSVGPVIEETQNVQKIGFDWEPKSDNSAFLAVTSKKEGNITLLQPLLPKSTPQTLTKHSKRITSLKWSKNGLYLSSGSVDGKVYIWNMSKRQVIRMIGIEQQQGISHIAWSPVDNQLAILDAGGQLGVLNQAISKEYPSPLSAVKGEQPALTAEEAKEKKKNNLFKRSVFMDDEAMEASGDEEEFDEEEEESEELFGEGRSRKTSSNLKPRSISEMDDSLDRDNSFIDDDVGEDLDGSLNRSLDSPYHKRHTSRSKAQGAFQVGSAPEFKNYRCLCWSTIGKIFSLYSEQERHHTIEISFNDTSKSRSIRMTDHYGYTMASLSETGAIFASCSRKNKTTNSTLFFRSFDNWASNSEWTLQLAQEEIKCVAISNKVIGVYTSDQVLRIFTLSGAQIDLVKVPGALVTMTSFEDEISVIYHRGAPFEGTQFLGLLVYHSSLRDSTYQGDVPLSPKSTLHWAGYNAQGALVVVDSAGKCDALMKSGNQIQESYSSFSASIKNTISPALKAQMQNKSKISSFCYWSPLMTLPNSGDVFHWVIGFSEDSLIFIKCTSAKYPTLFPNYIPVPSTLQVKVPVINAESQSGSIEEELIRSRMKARFSRAIEERVSTDISSDKLILRLILIACNENKLQKAFDLTKLLSFAKAIDVAIQLAGSANLNGLVEKMYAYKSEFLQSEESVVQQEEEEEILSQTEALYLRNKNNNRPSPKSIEPKKSIDLTRSNSIETTNSPQKKVNINTSSNTVTLIRRNSKSNVPEKQAEPPVVIDDDKIEDEEDQIDDLKDVDEDQQENEENDENNQTDEEEENEKDITNKPVNPFFQRTPSQGKVKSPSKPVPGTKPIHPFAKKQAPKTTLKPANSFEVLKQTASSAPSSPKKQVGIKRKQKPSSPAKSQSKQTSLAMFKKQKVDE